MILRTYSSFLFFIYNEIITNHEIMNVIFKNHDSIPIIFKHHIKKVKIKTIKMGILALTYKTFIISVRLMRGLEYLSNKDSCIAEQLTLVSSLSNLSLNVGT